MRRGDASVAVHAGRVAGDDLGRPLTTPIVQSATFAVDSEALRRAAAEGDDALWWYTRLGNPTVAGAAAVVAALEGAEATLAFASGMAAISCALLELVPPGGHVVAAAELYGDTLALLREELEPAGRRVTLVGLDDAGAWERALADGADALYVEALSNPMLRVADLPALARLAHRHGALAVVDATFATPCAVRPLEHGFDVVVHSATKYLNGHADVVAGVASGSAALMRRLRARAVRLGATLDPQAVFLLARVLRTLPLRMERHRANALALARRLEAHPEVEAVHHPSLPSHPDHERAATLLAGGCGLVTVRVRGGDARAEALLDELGLIVHAASLGGVESLACTPHTTSHVALSAAERVALGILPGTVRISVGIEDERDLVADLEGALARTAARAAA